MELYQNWVAIFIETRQEYNPPEIKLNSHLIQEKLEAGRSLFSFSDLVIDWPLYRKTFIKIFRGILSGHSQQVDGTLVESIASDISNLQKAASAFYLGEPDDIFTGYFGTAGGQIGIATHLTLQIFLSAYADIFKKSLVQDVWRHGHCPLCSGKPDISYLDKDKSSRWLLCNRCDNEWLFQRLECPYCGNKKQEDLSYLVDDSGLYRLYLCEKCHSYLKAIDLRKAPEDILLPLERVMTADLDKQGIEKGYHSPNIWVS